MMHRIILSVMLLTVMVTTGSAQPYRLQADSILNHLYLKKSWGELLDQSHSLLQRGLDSYNLRSKAGVAAYELYKYREAVAHLQKAYVVMPGDSVVNSYYFRALKSSEREDEASLLADKLSPDLRKAIKVGKPGIVSEIGVEALLARNKNFDAMQSEELESDGGISSYRNIEKSRDQYGISLGHHLFPHINLNHDFSMMRIDRVLQTNSRFNLPAVINDPSTLQYQYFLNARYSLMKGWSFGVSGSTIWGETYKFVPLPRLNEKSDLDQSGVKIKDNVFSLGISKETTYLNTALSAGYGMINGYRQYQGNLRMVFYPLGNNTFFFIPDVTVHWDEEPGDYNLLFQPQIGLKTDPFWISGEYGTGKMKNFFTGGGKVVYNVPETVTGYWGVTMTAPIVKSKLNLSARYRQSAKESTQYNYVFSEPFSSGKEKFSYTDQSVMVFLKWNF